MPGVSQQGRVPDFFIIGQPKSGTTALYEMLKSHPQIYMPELKEPWYFASDLAQRAPGESRPSLDSYRSLFEDAKPGQRVGEGSTSYIWSQGAAEEIAALRPDARIIAILREPASFLRSLHLQAVQVHVEPENDFRKALALEALRRERGHEPRSVSAWQQVLLYSDRVKYVEQLERYRRAFSREQMLVLIYDDFKQDNLGTLRAVLSFLGVDPTFSIEVTEANSTVRVRAQWANRLLDRIVMGRGPVTRAVKSGVKLAAPRRLRRRALHATHQHLIYAAPAPADAQLMSELRKRFKPEVVALSAYLDRDLVKMWGYDEIE